MNSIKKFAIAIFITSLAFPILGNAATTSLAQRLKGFVLLQVQASGEAWYVNPADGTRWYLKDGSAAYQIMRSLGLGISESDYAKLAAGNAALRAQLNGKIVLRVQMHGEAYYLCPRTGALSYIKDGAAAFQIMRACGLGITNADLNSITMNNEQYTMSARGGSAFGGNNPIPALGNASPAISGCNIFPADNPWNEDISNLPVNVNSNAYIAAIGSSKGLHPDFGENEQYGIPYNIADNATKKVSVSFDYADESDAGPYPIPANPYIEAGSDQHLIVLQKDECKLYELYDVSFNNESRGANWVAGSGAIWDLKSDAVRPAGWTSADAAGLPILPGLVRYDEVVAGAINHAIRFTAPKTQNGYIFPARHEASSSADPSLPPMGLRVRLKANYDISNLPTQAKIIATAMKKYGMILADNGSSWFFQGAYSPGWNDDDLNTLKNIPGSAFEAVQTGEITK
jgi:hypothetical protein